MNENETWFDRNSGFLFCVIFFTFLAVLLTFVELLQRGVLP